jgi:hypothetical protein
MSDETALRHAEQQMLMARPWHVATEGSIWSITGDYPRGGGFTECLAQVLPADVPADSDEEPVVFVFIGAFMPRTVVLPAQITSARPLLLVHRDNPSEPYWEDDRVWLPGPGGAS